MSEMPMCPAANGYLTEYLIKSYPTWCDASGPSAWN